MQFPGLLFQVGTCRLSLALPLGPPCTPAWAWWSQPGIRSCWLEGGMTPSQTETLPDALGQSQAPWELFPFLLGMRHFSAGKTTPAWLDPLSHSHCSPTHSLSSHPAPSGLRVLALHTHSAQPSTCPRTCRLSQAALTLKGAPGPGVPLHASEFAHVCAVLSCHCQVHSAHNRPAPEPLPSKDWSLRSTG